MKALSTLLFTILLAVAVGAQAESLEGLDWSGFKSDGCTLWPDKDFADCCIEHDRAYFAGGPSSDRRRADDRLFRCVVSKNRKGSKNDARLMWLGVRIGGLGWLPTPFRWGYGRGYWKANGGWVRKSVGFKEKGRR